MNPLAIKYAILAALAAGLFFSGGTLAWKYQSAKVAAKQAQIDAMATTITNLLAAQRRDKAAVATAERLRAASVASARAARDALAAALLTNQDWASQNVPQEVQNVLP